MLIKKGTHSPFRIPKLLVDCNILSYKVRFTDSCKYTLPPEDQLDVNKLFGIGYFPYHHKNSVRFGWRYNPEQPDKMEIMGYWYDNGERMMVSMGFVDFNREYTYEMWMVRGGGNTLHHLKVDMRYKNLHLEVLLEGECDMGYLLRPYFGGNRKAPHDMVIVMNEA